MCIKVPGWGGGCVGASPHFTHQSCVPWQGEESLERRVGFWNLPAQRGCYSLIVRSTKAASGSLRKCQDALPPPICFHLHSLTYTLKNGLKGGGGQCPMPRPTSGRTQFCFGSLWRAQERRCYTNTDKFHPPHCTAKKILCTQWYHPLPECLVWPDNTKQTASWDPFLIPNENAPQTEARRRKSSQATVCVLAEDPRKSCFC